MQGEGRRREGTAQVRAVAPDPNDTEGDGHEVCEYDGVTDGALAKNEKGPRAREVYKYVKEATDEQPAMDAE